jgi:hypothetical protein
VHVCRSFVHPQWLLHRWCIAYATFSLWLVLHYLKTQVAPRIAHLFPAKENHKLNARASVFPVAHAVQAGKRNLLKGLMDAEVPSEW